jgi:hypothetical protein
MAMLRYAYGMRPPPLACSLVLKRTLPRSGALLLLFVVAVLLTLAGSTHEGAKRWSMVCLDGATFTGSSEEVTEMMASRGAMCLVQPFSSSASTTSDPPSGLACALGGL